MGPEHTAEHFATLAAPASPEQFAAAAGALCQAHGLDRWQVVRLRGLHLEEAVQSFHNAPGAAPYWAHGPMLDRTASGVPVLFGTGATKPPRGCGAGVAALARERRGACIVYLGCSAPALAPALVLPALQAALLAAHHAVQGLALLHARACPLSERELQCMQLFAQGLNPKQTAQALNISTRTVEHHLEAARARFGVATTMAAAYHALNQGWVDPVADNPAQAAG